MVPICNVSIIVPPLYALRVPQATYIMACYLAIAGFEIGLNLDHDLLVSVPAPQGDVVESDCALSPGSD